jgi:hypothetical protein
LALQRQLDVNNVALSQAKDKLAGDYGQLGKDKDQLVTDTTGKLADVEKSYRNNQSALKDWLYGQSDTTQEAIDKAEADARAAYGNTLKTGQSGNKSVAYDNINALIGQGGTSSIFAQGDRQRRQARDIWGTDLTWDQLAREQEFLPTQSYNHAIYDPMINANRQALEGFYGQQDELYGNTADAEERRWNAIQDFLNTGAEKKQQGFKVRG